MKTSLPNKHGFTLLEVVIAITILAFISMFTAESISRALKNKKKIETAMENNTLVRDTLRVMSEDIRKGFKYEDIHIALFNLAQKERQKRHESGSNKQTPVKKGQNPSDPPADPKPATGNPAPTTPPDNGIKKKEFPLKVDVVVTKFLGEKEELHFTSLNNIQTYEDAPVSDQIEVSYMLESCKNRINKKKRSQCLWRRTSHVLDQEIKEGGSKSVLVENVTEFSLRYLGVKEEPEWVDKWASDEQGDEMTKGNFPFAVEITLEVHDKTNKKSKPVKMTYVAPLRFPTGVKVPKAGNTPAPTNVDNEDTPINNDEKPGPDAGGAGDDGEA